MSLFKKSYEGIIKGFTKTIADLKALAEQNAAEQAQKTAEIKNLKAVCITLEEEGTKALSTAAKLEDLFE